MLHARARLLVVPGAVAVFVSCHAVPSPAIGGDIGCAAAARTIESAPSVDRNDPAGRVIASCGHYGAKAIAAREVRDDPRAPARLRSAARCLAYL